MSESGVIFAVVAVALYVAHHVGDYWVQTDWQARTKGLPGREGHRACQMHVASYITTQLVFILVALWVTGLYSVVPGWSMAPAMFVSYLTHYLADRREPLRRIAAWFPGKENFWRLGMPRERVRLQVFDGGSVPDNPSLGTGAWALDQSWHIFWGVFVPALIVAGVS